MKRELKTWNKQKFLVIGAGDIGRRVIEKVARRGAAYGAVNAVMGAVHAATSNPAHRAGLKRLGARPVSADLDRPGTLKRLPRNWTAMIHAAPPQSYLSGDQRTRNLLCVLTQERRQTPLDQRRNRRLVYLSTSGVYGDCGGERITESRQSNPRNARAKRRVDAERCLIRAAKQGMFRLIILRVPGIYAADRLPLERLRTGVAALTDADDVYTNHIHAADLAVITVAALHRLQTHKRPCVRIYHASDDSEIKMGAWFDLVADTFNLPRAPRLMRQDIGNAVSPALLSFMNESRRLDNTRMKRELRIRLQFATAADGVADAKRMAAQAKTSPPISLNAV